MSAEFQVTGLAETIQRMQKWPSWMQYEVQSRVIPEAIVPVLDAMRAESPEDTGAWLASLSKKQWPPKSFMDRISTVIGIVGSRRGAQWKNRANIAHLLESGWRTARGGTLEREDGSTRRSKLTSKAGEGVEVGRHPGFKIVEKAYQRTQSQVMGILSTRIPMVAAQVWEEGRA